ncbi:MAG: 2-oxo-4-hydroxy-4-carboxy-5-ureidoimidazoline decarboxylase [Gammaproteobacteria bacterium]|nr:2-oxo-4-hydroxy-4-carboxy-5-ureidoimidazoline decarboxylase [Gammaproteobacteria bacterium]
MDEPTFLKTFGGIYEHSPWIASRTWQSGLNNDHDTAIGLAQAMAKTVMAASESEQLALIKAHPDLAGREAESGSLTSESTEEQQSAGLSNCSAEEVLHFQKLNKLYKDKHGFPFILAVRNRNRQEIKACFENRLNNDSDTEFATALEQINTIALLRLSKLVEI